MADYSVNPDDGHFNNFVEDTRKWAISAVGFPPKKAFNPSFYPEESVIDVF